MSTIATGVEPIIAASNLEKFYPQPDGSRIQVISPTSIAIYPGQIIALLATAGIIRLDNPAKAPAAAASVTGPGETVLNGIEGVQKEKTVTGATKYSVPLAQRKLVSVDKVTMIRPHLAQVEYSWQWKPNRLGQEFDASGSLVKSFSTWDRATLIKSFGVDFYSAAPAKASIVLMEGNNGAWRPYTE